MNPNAKKQHYVWQHYLRAWSIDNQLYCKRGNSIFLTSTENVAQERYFYEAVQLNETEILLVRNIIARMHPSAHELLNDTFDVYLEIGRGDDHLRRNGIEKFHSITEGKTVPIMNSIRDSDFEVLKNQQNRSDFSHFLGRQYTRTKKIKDKVARKPSFGQVPEMFASCVLGMLKKLLRFY